MSHAPFTDPRLAALGVIRAVRGGQSLDAALAERAALADIRDRALAAELSYGVCRWHRRLEALITGLLQRPLKARDQDVHTMLLIGAYQLLHSRVPPHAALSTAVEGVRQLGKPWAAGLVNGVLRRLQREKTTRAAAVDQSPATRFALPDWLYQAIARAWPNDVEAICTAFQQRPPMTLRVDLARLSRAQYAARLGESGIVARPHPTVDSALLLDKAVGVEQLPGFAEGLVSVQDAGAQRAAVLLGVEPGQSVLDACAAPGGKTLHVLQSADRLRVTAIDIDPERLQRVAQNLARGGVEAELIAGDVVSAEAGAWSQRRYDRILLDAPCSATGVLRRHPDIRLLRRAEDIAALAVRQDDLLAALWRLLEPGGRLLYVTCSILPSENAERIERFLAKHPDADVLELPTRPGRRSGKGVQLLPGIDETDGFFYAAVHKDLAAKR